MKTSISPKHIILLCCLTIATVVAPLSAQGQAKADEKPLTEQAFLGLYLRDIPDSPYAVVSWILPGPLEGTNFSSRYVRRGDIVLAVNDEPRSAAQFRELLKVSSPGDVLRFTIQRGTGDIFAAVPDPGGERGASEHFEIALGSAEEWTGPIHRRRANRDIPSIEPSMIERTLRKYAEQKGIDDGLNDLLELFAQTQRDNLGFHALSRVVAGFFHPLSVDAIGEMIIAETKAVPASPLRGAHQLIAANLDLDGSAIDKVSDETIVFDSVEALAAELHRRVDAAAALSACDVIDESLAAKAMRLIDVLARNVYISGDPQRMPEHLEVLRASMRVDYNRIALQAAALYPAPIALSDSAIAAAQPIEYEIEAVSGTVLYIGKSTQGYIIIGGPDSNTYQMDEIAAVYDVGGDDTYIYTKPRIGKSTLIVDVSGNDTYRGEAPFAGPASAIVGASIIHDLAGNDRYEGSRHVCAAGLFGIAIILDEAGNDVYEAQDWSQGAGMFGAGLLIDLAGHDAYLGQTRVQGFGATKGLGAIIDGGGNDLFRANGPIGSAYGTPAVYVGFSQGIGYGIRQYASGGIGVISNLGGHDRYEAGEFSQGGAYYWGLGLLHDAAGDDLYYGNRYGQGFGCHQSIGMLIDEAGDDTYWSMTAASQGGSWDIGVGLLLDKGGNDAYRADGLSQGSASMQAIGLLVDLGGQDRYIGRGGATQGQGGGNSYHYSRTGCFSFSALIDFGEEIDYYSSGRPNNSVISTGAFREDNPEASTLFGLFIDGIPLPEGEEEGR